MQSDLEFFLILIMFSEIPWNTQFNFSIFESRVWISLFKGFFEQHYAHAHFAYGACIFSENQAICYILNMKPPDCKVFFCVFLALNFC